MLLRGPCLERLVEVAEACTERAWLVAPFVRYQTLSSIVRAVRDSAAVGLITKLDMMSLRFGALDTDSARCVLGRGGNVYTFDRLHAKIYAFDDTDAIVTSSNLTDSGLRRNYEYGVHLTSPAVVRSVRLDVEALVVSDEVRPVDSGLIDDIDRLLSLLPRPRRELRVPHDLIDCVQDSGRPESLGLDEASLLPALTGWRRAVFEVLTDIEQDDFQLRDVYAFEQRLQQQYPENQHIRAKIRQQLQELRDMGLVAFMGEGRYVKRWL